MAEKNFIGFLASVMMYEIDYNHCGKSIRSVDRILAERIITYIEDNYPQYRINPMDDSKNLGKIVLTGERVLN